MCLEDLLLSKFARRKNINYDGCGNCNSHLIFDFKKIKRFFVSPGNFLQNIMGNGLDDDESPSPSTPSIASSSHSQCTRPERVFDLD